MKIAGVTDVNDANCTVGYVYQKREANYWIGNFGHYRTGYCVVDDVRNHFELPQVLEAVRFFSLCINMYLISSSFQL